MPIQTHQTVQYELPNCQFVFNLCEETISRADEGQPRPKYIFNKCGTNIYFFTLQRFGPSPSRNFKCTISYTLNCTNTNVLNCTNTNTPNCTNTNTPNCTNTNTPNCTNTNKLYQYLHTKQAGAEIRIL